MRSSALFFFSNPALCNTVLEMIKAVYDFVSFLHFLHVLFGECFVSGDWNWAVTLIAGFSRASRNKKWEHFTLRDRKSEWSHVIYGLTCRHWQKNNDSVRRKSDMAIRILQNARGLHLSPLSLRHPCFISFVLLSLFGVCLGGRKGTSAFTWLVLYDFSKWFPWKRCASFVYTAYATVWQVYSFLC